MERVTYTGDRALANWVLVPASGDRVIRVLQIVASSWEDWSIALASNPQGAPVPLSQVLHLSKGVTRLRFGRRFSLNTVRGAALGVTTAFRAAEASHTLVVWYDMVD